MLGEVGSLAMFRVVCALMCAASVPCLAMAQHMNGPPETNAEYFDPADLRPDEEAPQPLPNESWEKFFERLDSEGYQIPEGLHPAGVEIIGGRWRRYDEPSLYDYSRTTSDADTEIWRLGVWTSLGTPQGGNYRLALSGVVVSMTYFYGDQRKSVHQRVLQDDELQRLRSTLDLGRFRHAKDKDCQSFGRDGTTALVEYASQSEYVFLDCWGPDSDWVRELIGEMQRLADLYELR